MDGVLGARLATEGFNSLFEMRGPVLVGRRDHLIWFQFSI